MQNIIYMDSSMKKTSMKWLKWVKLIPRRLILAFVLMTSINSIQCKTVLELPNW